MTVRAGTAIVVTEPAVFTISGPGAVTCMQGLLTNDVERPGDSGLIYGALLTPKGMIIADVWVARSPQELTLLAHPAAHDAIASVFQKTLPPRLARVTDLTTEMGVAWLVGPGAFEALVRAGLGPLPEAAGQAAVIDTVHGRLLVALGQDDAPFGAFLAGRGPALDFALDVLEDVGLHPDDPRLLDGARILAGWPALGAEIGERTLPQEVRYDEIGGVSYTKGCYTGQETVARVHFRGHVNRELRGLRWDHVGGPDQPGIEKDGKPVGDITSVLELEDRTLALAVLRREIAVGDTVDGGGRLATVVPLPFRQGDIEG
jgi:folate-binding protein YgfZ